MPDEPQHEMIETIKTNGLIFFTDMLWGFFSVLVWVFFAIFFKDGNLCGQMFYFCWLDRAKNTGLLQRVDFHADIRLKKIKIGTYHRGKIKNPGFLGRVFFCLLFLLLFTHDH